MANGTLKVENIQTSSGSGTITLGQSGETITIPTGTTVSGAMSNKPAFFVVLGSDQASLADNVFTTITFDTKIVDTNNAYDTSTYRFTCPSGHSGKYYVGGMTLGISGAVTTNSYSDIYLRKNGSNYFYQMSDMRNNHTYQIMNPFGIIMDLEDDDYIDLQVRFNVTTGTTTLRGNTSPYETNFYGYKLIGA